MKKAEKVVSTFTAHDLSCKSDLDKLLDILDSAFKDETIENAYNIYLKFTYLKKQPEMFVNDYILEFENLTLEMNNCNMTLPDTVLPFKILEGAMINENQHQMTLKLASDLTLTPLHLLSAGEVELPTKFSKFGGLDRTSIFRRELLGKRG